MTLALPSHRSALIPGKWIRDEQWRQSRGKPSLIDGGAAITDPTPTTAEVLLLDETLFRDIYISLIDAGSETNLAPTADILPLEDTPFNSIYTLA